jgi:hypothetical protein
MVHPAREEGSEISVAPISKAPGSRDSAAGLKRQSKGTSSSTTSRTLHEIVHPAQPEKKNPAFSGSKQTLVESRSDWQSEVGDGPAEDSIRNVVEETSDIPAILKKVEKPGFVSKLPPWQDALAGATAGLGSTLLLHPLDVIKTRLQGKALLCSILFGQCAVWSGTAYLASGNRQEEKVIDCLSSAIVPFNYSNNNAVLPTVVLRVIALQS